MISIQAWGAALSMAVLAGACAARPPASPPPTAHHPRGTGSTPVPRKANGHDLPSVTLDCPVAASAAKDGSHLKESYPLPFMQNWLNRDAELQQQYGKAEVHDCSDAQRLAKIHAERETQRPTEGRSGFMPPAPPVPELWIECPGVAGQPADIPAQQRERYSVSAMQRVLAASPELQSSYGKPDITSCSDARHFMGTYRQAEARIFRDHGIVPPPPPLPRRLIHCSGGSINRPPFEEEQYAPELIEAWLRSDSQLHERYGKSTVDDCTDARHFMDLYRQDQERLTRDNGAPGRQLDPPGYVAPLPERTLDCTDVPGGARLPGPETYLLNVIERLIASDGALRQIYGKAEVRDCIDARRFRNIRMHQEQQTMAG